MNRQIVRKIAIFLALLLFCLLFWFLSPAVSVSSVPVFAPVWVRLIVVALVFLVWLAIEALAWYRHGSRDKAMAGSLEQSAATAGDGSKDDIREIDEKFRRALKLLRQRRFGGNRQRLYQLPWYLMIGPPGSGKTTWIRNSGLRFPLADVFGDDRIQGVGGTRTCDWWFTEDAVMLDTAGRFSTQDSDQAADSATWMGLLDSLRKHRNRRPLDGVIVMFSIAELMAQTPEQVAERGRRLNRRLAEIGERIGTRFPVYLIFTKADLIAGFTEYFDDLTRDERDQVWGATLSLGAQGDTAQQVEQAIDGLLGRLDERLLSRLHDENNRQRDALIHGFPFQFASLKPVIRELVGEIWRPAAYGESPVMARGVYFSSGTQEGDPFDRILRTIARDFGLTGIGLGGAQGNKRSFFIARVLKDVIFPEAGLVGNTGFVDRYRTWIQRALIFGSAALLLLFGALFYVSYANNKALIAEASAKADAARKVAAAPINADTALLDLLPALDALRDFPSGYARAGEPVPGGHGFGLHQGKAYGGAARDAYVDALNRAFQPALMRDVAYVLRGESDPGRRYRTLKLYLMLGAREHLDGPFMAAAAGVARERYGELRPEAVASLRAHAQALADPGLAGTFRKPAMDTALVEQARRDLTDMDPAAQVYQSLSQALADTDMAPWRMRDYVTGAERYFTSDRELTVPPLFTRKGYADLFLKNAPDAVRNAASEGWVLGAGEGRPGAYDSGRLTEGVTRLYFQDYRQAWSDLIGALQLQQPAAGGLRAFVVRMADRDSPMRQALGAIAAELDFSAPAADKAAALLKGKMGAAGDLLAGAAGGDTEALDPRKAVSAEFTDLINLVRGPKPPLDDVLLQLKDFANALRDMERSGDANALQNAIDTLRDDASGQPAPLDGWLNALADSGKQTFVKESGKQVSGAWSGGSDKKCTAVNGRYPFQPGARDDVNLADFADLFGYGGVLDAFFNQHMKAQVDQSGATWRWKNPDQAPSLPAEALGMFQRADEIRQAFFRQGSSDPKVELQITSKSIDSRATNATLVLGGKTLVFRPNVPTTFKVTWPFDAESESSYLVFVRADGGMTSPQPYDGPWSMFRMFAGHLSQAGSRDRFRLVLEKDGLQAEFEVKALSVDNPFALRMDRFRCLGNL